MPSDIGHLTNLPPEQQRIRDKCYHPTGTFIPFPQAAIQQSIPERFEQIVATYPGRLAVKTRNHQLTYTQLNQASERLARALLSSGGKNQEPIILLFEHDAPAIVGLLGVLKAGKFYVFLDTRNPIARLKYIVEDTQARLIVTNNQNEAVANQLAPHNVQLLNIDDLDNDLLMDDPHVRVPLDAFAYIVYTSGSTGRPKGVIVNHHDVLHFSMVWSNLYHICPDDRVVHTGPFSFSGSAVAIFSSLLRGATFMPVDIRQYTIREFIDWMKNEEVSICSTSPPIFRQLFDTLTVGEEMPTVRLVTLGGDRVYKSDVELFQEKVTTGCLLRTGLGTSEVKLLCQFLIDHNTVLESDIVPVGYPVEDIDILLLDDAGNPVGINDIGEIAAKSLYMSSGYWRRPDLTRARFLPDPNGSDERIYLTGDLGKMLPDGCLIHLGRKDFQVKIRGQRVEIVEVEEALLNLDVIKDAVVATQEEPGGDQHLVAYLVPSTPPTPTVTTLRRALTETLPDYMIPSTFVFLDALPLNPNGKVDRLALPAPSTARPELDMPFVSPRTPVEEGLAKIWAEVLSLHEVGIHDDFLELGGHSLLATQIVSRVLRTFLVEVPLHALFESPTVADMAVVITQYQAKALNRETLDHMVSELEQLSDEDFRQ